MENNGKPVRLFFSFLESWSLAFYVFDMGNWRKQKKNGGSFIIIAAILIVSRFGEGLAHV